MGHIAHRRNICWKLWLYHNVGEEKANHLLFYNSMVLVCKFLNPFHPRMLYAKFGWNWPNGLDFVNVFLVLHNYLLFEKGAALQLHKLKFPLCKSLVVRENFFKIHSVNVFSLFRNYLSFEKDVALHLNKFESPFPKNVLCQFWLNFAQCFLENIFYI